MKNLENKDQGKPLLRALGGESVSPPPWWLMRQAGRYLSEYRELRKKAGSFLDLCYTPELAAEATLQPVRRFGMDAAILFSDILVVPAALGRKVSFRDGDGPSLEPLGKASELGESFDQAQLEPVYAALRLVKAQLSDRTALIGFAGGPWTLACYVIAGHGGDFAAARSWCKTDAAGLDRVTSILAAAVTAHLAAQIEAGAETVQIFDSWAGLLAGEEFRRWVIGPTKRIVGNLKRRFPRVPIIGFPRNAGAMVSDYFAETGVNAVSLDWGVNLDRARALQNHGPVQGNLDPALLVAGGKGMEKAVRDILQALGSGPFVFNLGHGILQETPVENVTRLGELLRGGL
jgi:uroporphyrinogen decarboxylase